MANEGDNDAVLAFLLGSTPSLGTETSRSTSRAIVGDPPGLESVSDSDIEPETEASAAIEANSSDWDAITSCESEDEALEQHVTTVEATPATVETLQPENVEEGGPAVIGADRKVCNDPGSECNMTSEGSDDAKLHQLNKKRSPKKGIRKQKLSILPVAMPTKIPKARPKSTGNRADTAAKLNPTASKNLSAETKVEDDPTPEELLFVGCVAIVLVAYLVACVYSFFHPVVLPLPNYEELYSAYDISNVSVHIVNPVENSLITPQGVFFEWELANFPTEALGLYGAEVFQYQVSLNGEVITSELGFLATQEEDGDAKALSRTVRFPIPLRKFIHKDGDDETDLFKLHLKVTIPVPGLIEELKTYEQDVIIRKPAATSTEDGVQLTLTSPVDGAIFEHKQPIVLEYSAVNVHSLEVVLDDTVFTKKTHVNDGNMLLRGLGVGPHKCEIRAVDEHDETVATSITHVKITEAKTP
ncbi:hypothetical protein V7S43_012880 [Phytophthora oleae]|uniref:Uncharacterized protein n=1 Tax=Phytophthora oleae TaxID=2107226 RepID=A0ABD3F7W9_9STRA